MASVVPITDKIDILPFQLVLKWDRYQLFCTDVLSKRPGTVECREFLNQGNKQDGIDLYAIQRGQEKFTVAQCKLEESLGPAGITALVDEFLKGQFVSETAEFILCTHVRLKSKKAEIAIQAAREKLRLLEIDLIIWDEEGMSRELRTNPSPGYIEIVYHYFDEAISQRFFGDRWEDHIRSLRPVSKQVYSASMDYIERSITSYEERLKKPGAVRWNPLGDEQPKHTLMSLVKKALNNKPFRIALLSTAGFGKSEELVQLAAHFSSPEEVIFPVKFSLGNYTGQDIETILSQWNINWRNIPRANFLLIFDGIDEIGKPDDIPFYKKMNAFTELYPEIKIVVSSRFNFYEPSHQPLNGFSIYLLDPLNWSDIENYLNRRLGADKVAFRELIYNKGFTEYQNNPYYLTRLVRFFNDKQTPFPANKTELFERILFEQLSKDQVTYKIPGLRAKLYAVATRIAFCMTLAGKSFLTDEELSLVITDEETRTLLHNFAILNRSTSSERGWTFEHKNMQEYLCANALKKASFQELQRIISLAGNPDKLLPKFLNTVSFLFELLDKMDPLFITLFNWISSNEPELLIRFEKEQIQKTTRNEIFFRVFASYKTKGLSLRSSSNFSFQELAAFVGVDETIVDFLAREIKPSLLPGLMYDAVNIISLCDRGYTLKEKISGILFSIIEDADYASDIKASCIRSFYYLGFTDRGTFDRIFEFAKSHPANHEIRGATLHFLEQTDFQEDFSNYIIENFRIEATASNDREPREAVKRMTLKFTSSEKIKALLRFCASHPKVISQHHSYRSLQFDFKETQEILTKATALGNSDPSLIPVIYRLFISLGFLGIHDDWNKPFVDFFEKTCGKERIFRKFYQYGRRPHDMLLFAEEKTCDFIIEEIKNGNVSTNEAIIIRNVLSHINQALFQYFYQLLKRLPDAERFTWDEDDTDYNALRKEQASKNQEMLLNKSLFIDEAKEVFKAIGKDKITVHDLWFSETKALRRLNDSIALEDIRDVCRGDDDKEISQADYFSKFETDKYWEGLVVETVKRLVEEDPAKTSIRPELIQWYTDWTIREVERIDFEEHNIVEYDGGGYGYFNHTEFVKQSVQLLKPDLTDDLLIKLLKADYSSFYSLDASGGEEEKRQPLAAYIMEKMNDKERLRKQLLINIRDPKTAYRVRSTHFKICEVLGYAECLPELFASITHPKILDGYDRVKLSEIYVAIGGRWTDFKQFLALPTSDSYEKSFVDFHWHLIEKMLYDESEKITRILLEILEKDTLEAHRIKAAEFLIKLSRIEGLRYWLAHVKSRKGMLFETRWETFYDHIRKMPFHDTVDIFIEALDGYYQVPPNPETRFWRLDDTVFNSLVNLAIQGETQLSYIQDNVEKLLARTADENYRYTIKYFRERILVNYYQTISQPVSLTKANELFDRYLSQ